MFDKGIKIKPGDEFLIRTDLSSYASYQYKPSKSTKNNVKKENINNMKKANILYSCMFEEIPGVNLFDISDFYLSVLEELVLECEKIFKK